MKLEKHKIIDGGIWISEKELEEWRLHYVQVAGRYRRKGEALKYGIYLGKADALCELLKHIDEEKEEEL